MCICPYSGFLASYSNAALFQDSNESCKRVEDRPFVNTMAPTCSIPWPPDFQYRGPRFSISWPPDFQYRGPHIFNIMIPHFQYRGPSFSISWSPHFQYRVPHIFNTMAPKFSISGPPHFQYYGPSFSISGPGFFNIGFSSRNALGIEKNGRY
jgi:hypothetical protein